MGQSQLQYSIHFTSSSKHWATIARLDYNIIIFLTSKHHRVPDLQAISGLLLLTLQHACRFCTTKKWKLKGIVILDHKKNTVSIKKRTWFGVIFFPDDTGLCNKTRTIVVLWKKDIWNNIQSTHWNKSQNLANKIVCKQLWIFGIYYA